MQSVQEYLQQPGLAKFPFLFVVTYGRSGSTLLVGLLNSLAGYHIRGENNGALFLAFRATERLRTARFHWGSKENSPEDPWYGAHLIAPDIFERGCVDAFFRAALRPPLGTRCCGFKEIRYTDAEMSEDEFTTYLDFISRLFPGAAFIFNFRDIEATARSGWWKTQDQEVVRRRLHNACQRMLTYAENRPDKTYSFNYDTLLQEVTHFAGLCNFLGEAFDERAASAVISKQHSVIAGKR